MSKAAFDRWFDGVTDAQLDDMSQTDLALAAWSQAIVEVGHAVNFVLGCPDHDQPTSCEVCWLREKAVKAIKGLTPKGK